MRWFVFDLDDTLLDNRKGRPRVARQTWHVLKRLCGLEEECRLAIVSYNPGVHLWAGMCGLTRYIPRIGFVRNPTGRQEVVASVLPDDFDEAVDSLYYFDDRIDNIQEVMARYPQTIAFEVRDPRLLHLQVKSIPWAGQILKKKTSSSSTP